MGADVRVPLMRRHEEVMKVRVANVCCTGLVAKAAVASPLAGDVFTPVGLAVLNGYARGLSFALSVADIERMHKVTNTIVTQDTMKFENFAAVSLLKAHTHNAMAAASSCLSLGLMIDGPRARVSTLPTP